MAQAHYTHDCRKMKSKAGHRCQVRGWSTYCRTLPVGWRRPSVLVAHAAGPCRGLGVPTGSPCPSLHHHCYDHPGGIMEKLTLIGQLTELNQQKYHFTTNDLISKSSFNL